LPLRHRAVSTAASSARSMETGCLLRRWYGCDDLCFNDVTNGFVRSLVAAGAVYVETRTHKAS